MSNKEGKKIPDIIIRYEHRFCKSCYGDIFIEPDVDTTGWTEEQLKEYTEEHHMEEIKDKLFNDFCYDIGH